jgi:2-aminoadipate transaminase
MAHSFAPNELIAKRMANVPTSFIREILKVTAQPDIISFAGGLPNAALFPVDAMKAAADKVLTADGRTVLQYAPTEGYMPLREYIAARYNQTQDLDIKAEEVLITSGSQQGIDLVGKVLLNPRDVVALEKPGYLGAIQSLSVYEPRFESVRLTDDGVDTLELESLYDRMDAAGTPVKMFAAIPNFQNPTGLSYTGRTRELVAEALVGRNTVVIEDDPYGDLRFFGSREKSLKAYFGDQCVLFGSFSKVSAPGLRLGWLVAAKPFMEKFIIAKQATDLHTNYFAQRVMFQYLLDNDLDAHIRTITSAYQVQRDIMMRAIEQHFPAEARPTKPEGGMFVWVTMPETFSTVQFFDTAIKEKVAFVPGTPFYVDGGGSNTMRLNYTCASEAMINEGVHRLGTLMHEQMQKYSQGHSTEIVAAK